VILYVSGEYPPDVGGVGDYTHHLRAALTEVGCESAVVTRRQVGHWDARSLVWLVRNAPRTGVLHIQFQAAAYALLGDVCLMPGLLRRARPRLKTVTTFHDVRVPYLFPRAGRLRQAAIQLLARTSDAVIAADSRDLEWLGGPSARHHHIPIGPNVACAPPADYGREAFRARLGLQADDLAVVYFGLLNASKGLELLIGAFERVLEARPSSRLLLLGGRAGASDPGDRVTALRIQPALDRLGDRVIQPGFLPSNGLSAYLLAGDVALLPYADGASARRGSLLACAVHGLPIVSTQPAGVEVAPFVEAVEADARVLADAVMHPNGTLANGRLAAEKMSWPRIAEAHLDVYRQ
jgi:glycosyltransferase involved in cell wall biosynthesis